MGTSTPSFRPSSWAALVVLTPSATLCMPARMSASFLPLPSSRPTVRLRDRSPVQVSTRSPSPARPAKASGAAPGGTPPRAGQARRRRPRRAELHPGQVGRFAGLGDPAGGGLGADPEGERVALGLEELGERGAEGPGAEDGDLHGRGAYTGSAAVSSPTPSTP